MTAHRTAVRPKFSFGSFCSSRHPAEYVECLRLVASLFLINAERTEVNELSPVHTSNNVEATLSKQHSTL